MRVHEVDWESWHATDRAVLLFVLQNDQILLIEKKRGLGAGKINGPGGKLEPGESFLAAALRETEEEIGVRPKDPQETGRLFFEFLDGYKLEVAVFLCRSYQGALIETDEAKPFWVPVSSIPYELMWADDALWLPEIVQGKVVFGRFIFDGDRMEDYALRVDGVGGRRS
ncbi:MAG: 8-oxo-dGTP diphosphatase [Alkalispirochaetaceae bacterium]